MRNYRTGLLQVTLTDGQVGAHAYRQSASQGLTRAPYPPAGITGWNQPAGITAWNQRVGITRERETSAVRIKHPGTLNLSDRARALHFMRMCVIDGVSTYKDNGIINGTNLWCVGHSNERYLVDLLKKIVRESVETVKIVERGCRL